MTAFLPLLGRNPCRWLGLAAALLLPGGLPAAQPPGPELKVFEVGLARTCFPNVNHNDAVAAYTVLLQNIGQREGYRLRPEVTIYDDTSGFATAIKRGTIHIAVMDASQFLDMEQFREIRPSFVPAVDGRVGRIYLVLARRGSGIRSLADLRGRTVVRLEAVNNNVCRTWLETLLPGGPASAFFATLESATKPTAAVLPVFFGQKAACIVDDRSFNLMKELNPQVGDVLEVIARSDLFVDVIVCLGEQNWASPEAKADAMRILGDVAADPAGRQVLTLFKISGMVAFQDGHLATVRALRRTHEQLRAPRPAGDNPL